MDELKNHPAGDLTEVFPSQRVLPREALRLLEKASPDEILAHLAACFDPAWPFPPLSDDSNESAPRHHPPGNCAHAHAAGVCARKAEQRRVATNRTTFTPS